MFDGDRKAPLIYHIVAQAAWDAQHEQPAFEAASLADEGFIHCTAEPDMVRQVANRFYRDASGQFIILCIAPARLQAELRWEIADDHLFPHIYGPLNRDAVAAILPFPRSSDNCFVLPPELRV
ncbi:MAG: DUF952 domain-containing protein [Caldilinea sp.]|uniref:DUF952 domain-containing protein n=1 Tax=Caldilinea sp. TaxID=2293560 RepID=UPI002CE7D784|nr:DUF952 domain-containing protein [Caldilinea sp.]